jgi:hypothetical protein
MFIKLEILEKGEAAKVDIGEFGDSTNFSVFG